MLKQKVFPWSPIHVESHWYIFDTFYFSWVECIVCWVFEVSLGNCIFFLKLNWKSVFDTCCSTWQPGVPIRPFLVLWQDSGWVATGSWHFSKVLSLCSDSGFPSPCTSWAGDTWVHDIAEVLSVKVVFGTVAAFESFWEIPTYSTASEATLIAGCPYLV